MSQQVLHASVVGLLGFLSSQLSQVMKVLFVWLLGFLSSKLSRRVVRATCSPARSAPGAPVQVAHRLEVLLHPQWSTRLQDGDQAQIRCNVGPSFQYMHWHTLESCLGWQSCCRTTSWNAIRCAIGHLR